MTDIDTAWLAAHPLPDPGTDTDKNERGRVLIAGGSMQVPAALRLTGEAAFRAGAGKVQLATVEAAAPGLGMGIPEASVFALPTNADGELGTEAGAPLAALMERCDTLILGPGMGARSDAEPLLRAVLEQSGDAVDLVLDAAVIAAVPAMRDAVCGYPGHVVITPHPGEMAALMECDEEEVSPELAREAAERFKAIVVLKGGETWLVRAGEPMLHYPGGGPGLATGGSGDVLAGLIGGLLSRGAGPVVAAAWGVWLHGEAGRRLASSIGPIGFLAHELLGEVPGLMAQATNGRTNKVGF